MSAPTRRRRGCAGVVLLALLCVVAAAALLRYAQHELNRPRLLAPTDFTVAPGETSRAVLDRLERQGLIGSALVARLWLGRVRGDPAIHAGEYRFEGTQSAIDVIERLVRGEVVTWPVTLIEGLTFQETAAALAAAGFGSEERFLAEFADPGRVRDLDPAADNLEGYLYPDTYRFPRGTDEATITTALVSAFRRRFEREVRPLLAPGDARPLRELVILASLVEKEARLEPERPVIAAVYANRLRRGIGLYADPTIIYGLKLEGRWDGDLRRRDLESDSPWNTYRVAGLPPGPICSPGAASLRAAARPAEVPYLYFVSRNDGSHVFSTHLAEHNRNVDIWQRQYFRKRASGGAQKAEPAH